MVLFSSGAISMDARATGEPGRCYRAAAIRAILNGVSKCRSKKGISFDALDNQPVNLVMLFLVPQGQFQKHLHTLANIAKLLHRAEFRQALENAPNAEAMLNIIREQGRNAPRPA